jgi:hypothetical protein
MNMAPRLTQDDILCDTNTDGDTVEEKAENKDAGAAVNEALNKSKTKARRERTTFLAFHCPPTKKHPDNDCSDKVNVTGDGDDDLVPGFKSLDYDRVAKKWTAVMTCTWNASFTCIRKKK